MLPWPWPRFIRAARKCPCCDKFASMSLPQHTRHLVERLLSRYCSRICPPTFERQIRLGFVIDGNAAVVHELKPIFGIPGTLRRVDVARFQYQPADGCWRLAYNRDEPARWRPYPRGHGRSFVGLLAQLDADPLGLFWGRVNGASLRWCSSRGRCPDCEARYRAVLGGGSLEFAQAPAPVDGPAASTAAS